MTTTTKPKNALHIRRDTPVKVLFTILLCAFAIIMIVPFIWMICMYLLHQFCNALVFCCTLTLLAV